MTSYCDTLKALAAESDSTGSERATIRMYMAMFSDASLRPAVSDTVASILGTDSLDHEDAEMMLKFKLLFFSGSASASATSHYPKADDPQRFARSVSRGPSRVRRPARNSASRPVRR
ncbi:putative hydrolase of the metallo-beta-lactamase superfamily [Frog virus 3]|uniref:Putative hydrolase of the metallo-beta-lactamase superfamily n=1 Tax=Frog virus 3 TaxID=10493 RepID=A0A5B8P2Q7_FRG3V|nr:putative hydrolase of the metallo-beta-lactamase superfamily [Frog virus 3]QDZ45052.1 putative hydrolase of the metallo-beta-lactamase superfamily [Frog virus 3]QDZ45146.1 putative hydrolase of the metallo-beta-lactamase superfamily [Frog virus 3]QDZ45240.1 putative hydrolase of the metallo-beta-lactamase superfamily [Frog virus 3]QDZ45334.1 putative hydrolase of the metallo-beta-lactamase superfamily [Frog virus 3]